MKKISFLILTMFMVLFPLTTVNAQEYTLKAGKETKATYAGVEETDYNYFKFTATKTGFIEIKSKTSNKKEMNYDICDSTKELIATNINVKNGAKVLHKVKKNQTYYIRTKGEQNQTHSLSYKTVSLKTFAYAEKYSYIITNASITDRKNSILFDIKTKESGIMYFMGKTSNNISVQFINKKGKNITDVFLIKGNSMAGLGVSKNTAYKACVWNPTATTEGTTTIENLKYQIRHVSTPKHSSRGSAKELSKSKKFEKLLIAGKKSTDWYEIELEESQKIRLNIQSRLFNNNGLRIYICNKNGKALHKNKIVLSNELKVKYKKKYKMVYSNSPITTGKLPKGKYYIKVVSNNNKTTGSYEISWK